MKKLNKPFDIFFFPLPDWFGLTKKNNRKRFDKVVSNISNIEGASKQNNLSRAILQNLTIKNALILHQRNSNFRCFLINRFAKMHKDAL